MIIRLFSRHYGKHSFIKECNIIGDFNDYVISTRVEPNRCGIFYTFDEEKLIQNIPKNFLPVPTKNTLITVSDRTSGTGQSELKHFKNWSKYFDCYCLDLFTEKPYIPKKDGTADKRFKLNKI